jgi:antitoxin (DNA-binding transcriptional repressor) of toxin-antitoxin stability system
MRMSTVARKTRVVSARELSRRMATLLDEMESEEVALIVMRYGRPSAMFVPFEETGRAPKLPRISEVTQLSIEEDVSDDGLGDVHLSPDQEWILRDIAHCLDLSWSLDRLYDDRSKASARLAAVTRLEIAGLVERGGGGVRLTRKGSRLARKLDSTA